MVDTNSEGEDFDKDILQDMEMLPQEMLNNLEQEQMVMNVKGKEVEVSQDCLRT